MRIRDDGQDRLPGGKARKLVLLVTEGGNGSSLANVLAHLSSDHTLKDVRIVSSVVAPAEPIKLTTEAASLDILDETQRAILGRSSRLAPAQEARLQLQLLRFFMEKTHRDAAYICADNVKRILSSLPQEGGDGANQLTHELEVAEGELRQKLPY